MKPGFGRVVTTMIGLLASAAFNSAYAYHPAVDSFFNSSDPFVQSTVIPNIEKCRKADVVLQFRAADGSPLTGVQVQANMIKHSFLFGCCLLNSDTDRRSALWLDVFNFGLPEGAGKWDAIERTDGVENFSGMDNIMNWAESHGVTVEEHFLSGYVPSWASALPAATFAQRQLLHMRHVVDRYKDRIRFYQVDNEAKIANKYLWDSMQVSFPQYKSRFGICDDLNGTFWDLAGLWTMPGADAVSNNWPGITFAANQVHCATTPGTSGTWYSPRQFYEGMFNKYLDSKVKIQLTELDFPCPGTMNAGSYRTGTMTENLKAICYVQYLATAFSHPSVEATNFWGFGPGGYMPGSGFVDGSYNPLPCYDAVKSLIKEKFWTKSSGATDAQGTYAYRGFQGYYELVATGPNGLSIRDTFELKPGLSPVQIIVTAQGILSQVAKPVISPAGDFLVSPTQISITGATSGAQVRYTIDGADPTELSTLYSGPFTLSAAATIKARAYKTGMNPSELSAEVFKGLLAAENPANAQQGLNYSYYEGQWDALPDFQSMSAIRTGTAAVFDLTPANQKMSYFGLRFDGYIDIPVDGIYTFYMGCNDAADLHISSFPALKGCPEVCIIGLKAGKHGIRVDYYQATANLFLQAMWECQRAGIAKQTIPASSLYRSDNTAALPPKKLAIADSGPIAVYTIRGQRLTLEKGALAAARPRAYTGAKGVFVTAAEHNRAAKAALVVQ